MPLEQAAVEKNLQPPGLEQVTGTRHLADAAMEAYLHRTKCTKMTVEALQMLAKKIHRLIITREGRMCGIITTMDMLRALLILASSRADDPPLLKHA